MSKAIFKRIGYALIPTDDEGKALLSTVKDGREVVVSIKIARNPAHHRLLFAMLNFVVHHGSAFTSTDQALIALKIACGLVDPYIDAKSGKTFFVPRSIAFESMAQTEFSDFFNRATYVICDRWMPAGTTAEAVRAEILAMCDPVKDTTIK
jgi:hypothetical protein